ncbi:hypothetical protein KKG45_02280 [bacterium]|nr:hypothetical protein [bacterium]MBU1072055.1 hypothetical protein [bacterium]MBU1676707.1 hypothetical protein [bacterium]
MSRSRAIASWFRSPSNVIAGTLVLGGFILAEIDWGFIALTGVGIFGPGILRELGWLRDKDEFEMRAARRAGYHAYLVGGLVVFLLIAVYRSLEGPEETPTPIDYPSLLVTTIFAVLWFTWLLSSLLSYWGALKSARRILYAFGTVWLIFNIMAGEGNWVTSVMQSLLAVPFFAAAWLGPRWPRLFGTILLLASGYFFYLFGYHEMLADPLAWGRSVVLVLFFGPLVASGIALFKSAQIRDGDEET